jgi:DNA modification methylase
MNPCEIYTGDSYKVLKRLPAKSVHCFITSPPYFGLRSYIDETRYPVLKSKEIGIENDPQTYIENLIRVFGQVHRVLRDDGTFGLNIADTRRDSNLCGIPHRLVFALQDFG